MTRPRIRSAIYTRKSSEEGLEQAFNSLDAQREACAAYVASQKGEGWVLLPDRYDDGGISGGTLERPAVQRLLADIDAGRIDRVVVYKVDRLTRSLADFARLVERFEAAGCSFVSVTQSFNTATSMGRLTLNVLLSFAQFEREVTAERIRDKIAASKQKGLWMGGLAPLGYDVKDRALVINPGEAETVRTLFELYDRLGCVRRVKSEADRRGLVTKLRMYPDGRSEGGVAFTRGRIYHLLGNPIYAGRVRHGHRSYVGQHAPIVHAELWDRVQAKLAASAARSRRRETAAEPSPLAGRFTDETGDRLTPSHAVRRGRRYRYYVSHRLIARSGEPGLDGWRLAARTLELAVTVMIRAAFGHPAALARLIIAGTPAELAAVRQAADALLTESKADEVAPKLLALLATGRIGPSSLSLTLEQDAIAALLGVPAERIDPAALTMNSALTLRRRGVEAKLVLDDPAPRIDRTLLRNVALGHAWFEEIRSGTPMAAIATRVGVSQRRVARILDLAFLAPDIVERIAIGRQPVTLTTEALVRSPHRLLWSDQRAEFAGE